MRMSNSIFVVIFRFLSRPSKACIAGSVYDDCDDGPRGNICFNTLSIENKLDGMIFYRHFTFPQNVLGFRAMVVSREETAIFFHRSSRTTTLTQLKHSLTFESDSR